ncbi:hypothetical protein WMY93_021869 [Mugilogobius chulae]|uniref:Ribosome biogenesis protein BRX1 homolog n=1 Tax=Mugilogobius chulae TaxID=88201 RepID=A0AAW0NN38_9GOBI
MAAFKRKRGAQGSAPKKVKKVKFVTDEDEAQTDLNVEKNNEIPSLLQSLWVSNCPHGPSAKFLVQNIHTLAELKMTGNCLRGSRPLLSFDPRAPYALLKELFIQTFSTPRYHPKSQPFVDHVITFTIADNRIWFRNYQIIEEDASLVEIGPRFVLNLIKIFQGSFGGPTLFENENFQSPNLHRRQLRLAAAAKIREKQMVKELQKMKRIDAKEDVTKDVTEDVFLTPADDKPVQIESEPPPPKAVKKKNRNSSRDRECRWLAGK